jgi:hypothetical protein
VRRLGVGGAGECCRQLADVIEHRFELFGCHASGWWFLVRTSSLQVKARIGQGLAGEPAMAFGGAVDGSSLALVGVDHRRWVVRGHARTRQVAGTAHH